MIGLFKTKLEVSANGNLFDVTFFHSTNILHIYTAAVGPYWVNCYPDHKAFFLSQLMRYMSITQDEATTIYDILVARVQ